MKMKSKLCLGLIAILAVASCSQLPNTEVDRLSLLRSMTYTQRHLLTLELTEQPSQNSDRKKLLLMNYCDLIDRGVVRMEANPVFCKPQLPEQQACLAELHRCLGVCETYQSQCFSCEKQAANCMERDTLKDDG